MPSQFIHLVQLRYHLQRLFLFRWIGRVVLLILLIAALIGAANQTPALLGLFFILLPFGLVVDIFTLFLQSAIDDREQRQDPLHGGLTKEAAFLLIRSRRQPQRLWHYLLDEASVSFVFARLGLERQPWWQARQSLPAIEAWVNQAEDLAKQQRELMAPKHLFEVIQTIPAFDRLWQSLGVSKSVRLDVWQWWQHQRSLYQKPSGFLSQIGRSGGLGRDWSSGYTHALNTYASDLTEELERINGHVPLVGHTEERAAIVEHLSRDAVHNVLLVGDDGVGKQRLVYSLIEMINRGNVPLPLRYHHVFSLDTGKIVSGSNAAIKDRLDAVLSEASAVGNVVLFIPDIHLLLGQGQADQIGISDARQILKVALDAPSLHIIATVTPQTYYASIKPDSALAAKFLTIDVHEMKAREAVIVLEEEATRREARQNLFFTYPSLVKIIDLADRHVHGQPYPEKAIHLLDEVCGEAQGSGPVIVTPGMVEKILSQTLKVPLGQVTPSEQATLNNLEEAIAARIVGQKEAVGVVADALRRARAGLHSGRRPIGSFLFLGPTGVGKTEMAKTIAALYYQSDKAFIRIDMTEYQTVDAIDKLVGTRTTAGVLTTAVSDQPFSVILLDEVEKADAQVRNLFLQILDDGRATDGYGKLVDFTNTMVIATSNAGAEMIREETKDGQIAADFKARLLEQLQTTGQFSPEWLNRFDATVLFLPLSRDELRQIAKLQVNEVREHLQERNINLSVADDVYDFLVDRGYDPQFGARPMRRAVQDTIENVLARQLINDHSAGMKEIMLTRSMLEV